MAKQDALKNELDGLRNALPELRAVLLASVDGLPIAHALSGDIDPNRTAAIASAAGGLGKRICQHLGSGEFGEFHMRGEDAVLLVYAAGSKASLVVIGAPNVNIGLLHLEARNVANSIRNILEDSAKAA